MRDAQGKLQEQVTQVLTYLDAILKGRVEEARAMGEMTEAIRAINARMERQEGEVKEVRDKQEKAVEALRADIGELWEHNEKKALTKLGWWGQVALYIIAAVVGGIASKLFK